MESLKLKTKLIYLLFIIGSSIIIVGFVGYLNVQNIKRNLDTLYFGSLIPLNELNTISNTYHDGLASSIYLWSHHLISDEEAARQISVSLDTINQLWSAYRSHYKHSEELPYIEYTENQINSIETYFIQCQNLIINPQPEPSISLMSLQENIRFIQETLDQLIVYERNVAQYEHTKLRIQYENALLKLFFFLGVIVVFVTLLAWKIFSRIELQHYQLIESSETLKHLNLKLEKASYTDPLTSLFNRRYFNFIYEREFKRAIRSNKPLIFMMLDIDYFKQYNDTYGHIQGDNALKAVALVLKNSLKRPGDFAFRLGGEEFGVIVSDSDFENAKIIGEKIRSTIQSLRIEHKGSKTLPILTVSIGGICIVPTALIGNDALIHTADTNLYAAKERGRNQVVFSTTL